MVAVENETVTIPAGKSDVVPAEPGSVPASVLGSKKEEELLDVREKAVEAREKALDAREKASLLKNPTFLALLAAFVALLGNMFVTYFNNRTLHENEKSQEQSNLVLQAIRTGKNPSESCRNLLFFVNVGLLDDPHSTIRNQCQQDPTSVPSLPANPNLLFDTAAVSVLNGVVRDEFSHPIQGATVSAVGSYSVSTDANGAFLLSLREATTNPVRVTVEKQGYATTDQWIIPSLSAQLITIRRLK